MRVGVNCLIAAIVVKYVAALWVFPAYQREYRGDYAGVAGRSRRSCARSVLYATDVSATGLSVASDIDAHRFPQQPLQWPPREWTSGFVLSHTEDPDVGSTFREFPLGRSEVTCCAAAPPATRAGR